MKKEDLFKIQEAAKESEMLVGEINKIIICIRQGQDQAALNLILNLTYRIEVILGVLLEIKIEIVSDEIYEQINSNLIKIVEYLEEGDLKSVAFLFKYSMLGIITELDMKLRNRVAN